MSLTVTATFSGTGSSSGNRMAVTVLNNASTSPVGSSSVNTTTLAPQLALAPSATGSMLFGTLFNDVTSTAASSIDANTTSIDNTVITGAGLSAMWRSALTATTTSQTTGWAAPANTSGQAIGIIAEILSNGGTLAVDSSTPAVPATTTGNVTTAAFTPPSTSVLVATIAGDWNGSGTYTCAVTDSNSAYTWTKVADTVSAIGGVVAAIWVGVPNSGGSAVTVTATGTGGSADVLLSVLVLNNASHTQPGATAGNVTVTKPESAITPTAAGSLIVGSTANGAASTAFGSLAGNTTSLGVLSDTAKGTYFGNFRSTSDTASTASATYGWATPTTSAGNIFIAVAEILASGGTLVIDSSSPATVVNTTGTAATTASFTPPATSCLVAVVTTYGTTSVALTDSVSAYTWTRLIQNSASGTNASISSIWFGVPKGTPHPATAALTVTPALTASGTRAAASWTGTASLAVTPSFTAAPATSTAAALTVSPSLTAQALSGTGGALTVAPALTAAATDTAAPALTVTPSLAAAAATSATAALPVTPALAAHPATAVTASLAVSPVLTTAGARAAASWTVPAALTVTPGFSAAGTTGTTAALPVTLVLTAAAVAATSGTSTGSLVVTPVLASARQAAFTRAAALTVTPALGAGPAEAAAAALTIAPVLVAAATGRATASLTVTPVLAAAVLASMSAALAVTPSLTARAAASTTTALPVTLSLTAVAAGTGVPRTALVTLTVSPVLAASPAEAAAATLPVVPSLAAATAERVTASLTLSPVLAASPADSTTATALTVTPALTAAGSGGIPHSAAAALTVTPSVTSAAVTAGLVQKTSGDTTGSTLTLTFPAAVTAGNSVALALAGYYGGALTGVTVGGTAVTFTKVATSGGYNVEVWLATAVSEASATVVVTCSEPGILGWGYELAGSVTLDTSAGTHGVGASWSSGTTPETIPYQHVIIGLAGCFGAGTVAETGSGWANGTAYSSVATGSGSPAAVVGGVSGIQAASGAGAYTYSGTQPSSAGWAAVTAALLTVPAPAQVQPAWGGYVFSEHAAAGYTGVSATFTVPVSSAGANNSFWVGLGNVNQVGIFLTYDSADSGDGWVRPWSWWLPGAGEAWNMNDYPIAVGDSLTLSMSLASGNWVMTIANNTQAWSFSEVRSVLATNIGSIQNNGAGPVEWVFPLGTAEVIVEKEAGTNLDYAATAFTSVTTTPAAVAAPYPVITANAGVDQYPGPYTASGGTGSFTMYYQGAS